MGSFDTPGLLTYPARLYGVQVALYHRRDSYPLRPVYR
jgi:hypothetical protein